MPNLIGAKTDKEYTSSTDGTNHALLERYTDNVGNVWIFAQASISVAQYAAVIISKEGKMTQVTDTNVRKAGYIGFCQTNVNDGNRGWVLVQGKGSIKVAASCQPNVQLFTTGTSGVLDDSTLSTSQFQIIGVIATQSQTSGSAGSILATINNPNVRRLEVA